MGASGWWCWGLQQVLPEVRPRRLGEDMGSRGCGSQGDSGVSHGEEEETGTGSKGMGCPC